VEISVENFYKDEFRCPQSSYAIKVFGEFREVVNEKSQHLVFECFLLKSFTKELTKKLPGEELWKLRWKIEMSGTTSFNRSKSV
jgi:hypothetical protein